MDEIDFIAVPTTISDLVCLASFIVTAYAQVVQPHSETLNPHCTNIRLVGRVVKPQTLSSSRAKTVLCIPTGLAGTKQTRNRRNRRNSRPEKTGLDMHVSGPKQQPWSLQSFQLPHYQLSCTVCTYLGRYVV